MDCTSNCKLRFHGKYLTSAITSETVSVVEQAIKERCSNSCRVLDDFGRYGYICWIVTKFIFKIIPTPHYTEVNTGGVSWIVCCSSTELCFHLTNSHKLCEITAFTISTQRNRVTPLVHQVLEKARHHSVFWI